MTTPFARLELLLGADAIPRLQQAHVLIAGLGAVGAAAAESLTRSGIGRITLVDFDELRPSNINRHPFAFHSTIGLPKADTAARRLRDINPDADITPLSLFLDADTAPALLTEHPCDVLIDAIDSLLPKTELLLAAQAAQVPHILSCMGAARKLDPSGFTTADLLDTHTCPLARLIRKRIKRRGLERGIQCIFSTERPLDPTEDVEPAADFYVRGRLRPPMGSLHCVTASAGLLAARETLRHLLDN